MLRIFSFFLILIFCGCDDKQNEIRIAFAGDLLLDRGVKERIDASGVSSLFDGVRDHFQSCDAVVANLECPLTRSLSPIHKRYVFRADPDCAAAMKDAGITHLDLANNHSYDQGRIGIIDTKKHLDAAGLKTAGFGANQALSCSPAVIAKNGISVAIFASVLLHLEGWPYLADSAGICQATVEELCTRIRAEKENLPQQKIIVVLHWGAEFQKTASVVQHVQARALIDAGADAIIGHHPHVVQNKTIYKNKPVWFSLGNFIFDQKLPDTRQGLIVDLIISEDKITSEEHPIEIINCSPQIRN
jgi:poly-gamma-glutamate synthesis protein (capsule biosynthesis protein)